MDIQTLTDFFLWCTILNGGLLVFWTVICGFAPDLVYRLQAWWFPLPRQSFDVMIYGFLAAYKALFLVFNLVPYIALSIIG